MKKILCGESSEVLERFPDETFHCAITSPPYDNVRPYNGYVYEPTRIFREVYRTLKTGGSLVVVIRDPCVKGELSLNCFRLAIALVDDIGFKLHQDVVRVFPGVPGKFKKRHRNDHEYCFIFKKGDEITTFNNLTPELMVPLKHPNTRNSRVRIRGRDGVVRQKKYNLETGKTHKDRGTVYHISNGQDSSDKLKKQHQAPFPKSVATDFINLLTNPGDVVLDPMCGSGTVPNQAHKLGREYVGIDISEEYTKLTKKIIMRDNYDR